MVRKRVFILIDIRRQSPDDEVDCELNIVGPEKGDSYERTVPVSWMNAQVQL